MYKVDLASNSLHSLEEVSFGSLGLTERKHLQEWIVKNPQMLCHSTDDEFLIIQKEFSGFDHTNERLDLLALDKQGNLVLIENKLDDSGRDVVWQAIKYAGYCANLRKENIVDMFQRYLDSYVQNEEDSAEDLIVEFLGCVNLESAVINNYMTQRIILVAANFRKEVTNTALWLMQYGLSIQCFKAKPYRFEGEVLVDIKQVLPMPEAESYMIGMALKEAEEKSTNVEIKKQSIALENFWGAMFDRLQTSDCTLFNRPANLSKKYYHAACGISGLSYVLVLNIKIARIEFYISTNKKELNTDIFNWLLDRRNVIESNFGATLDWQPLPNSDSCRIAFSRNRLSHSESDESELIEWMNLNLISLEKSIAPLITPLKLAIKSFK